MKRREFIKKVSIGATAAAAATAFAAPAVHAQKTIHWKMVTSWPPRLPYLQTGPELFCKLVDEMSGGRLKIKVFAGGELVPALGCFDAVSTGTYQCYHSSAHYWAGKAAASQWFTGAPFGLNALGMNAWFKFGGALELYEELYKQFNLIPRPGGNTGPQMGGWFNKKIDTVDDFKGLKMRIPGLGGKVVAKAGGTVVLTPGGEIFTSLERGVIDATEWLGPAHDMLMGFYKAAKYYYYPGWHEPGSALEFGFNKDAYEGLPADLRAILDVACDKINDWCPTGLYADNGKALDVLINKYKVTVLRFPQPLLDKLRVLSQEALDEIAEGDAFAKKVNDSFQAFKKEIGPWATVSEKAYYDDVMANYALKA